MTKDQFQKAAGISAGLVTRWFSHLLAVFDEFSISTPTAQAMFIAQFGHESAGFTRLVESFNYDVAGLSGFINAKRITLEQARSLGRKDYEKSLPLERQRAIANLVYSKRNGNSDPGDGWKYRGRGIPQITGLNNYRSCGAGLKLDLVASPELLEQDSNAMRSAGWFWSANRCSQYGADVERVTLVINGGNNGIADRRERFELAQRVLV